MKCLHPDQCGIGADCSPCYEAEAAEMRAELARLRAERDQRYATDGPILMAIQRHLDADADQAWLDEIEDTCRDFDAELERLRGVEERAERMRSALKLCAGVLAGFETNKRALIEALEAARDVLAPPAPAEGQEPATPAPAREETK